VNIFCRYLCLFLLPALAFAKPPRACVENPKNDIFGQYYSLSDEEITEKCAYDIEKREPDADEARVEANERRASICEKGLTKMRDISQRYAEKKKEVCLKVKAVPSCDEATSQASCVVDAAKLSAEAEKGQEELGAIMLEGKEKLASVLRFNRQLVSKFKGHQDQLGRMPLPEKNRLFRDRINNPGIKPVPGRPERSVTQSPPDSSVSTPSRPPSQAAELPRPSTVSNQSSPAYEPPADMRPQDYGARSWADYEKRLPFLLQQSEQTTKQLQKFEEARVVRHTEHQASASELALKAAQFYAVAEKLGYAGEDLIEWKKENPPKNAGEALPAAPLAVGKSAPEEEPGNEPAAMLEAAQAAAKEKVTEVRRPAGIAEAELTLEGESANEPALSSFDPKLRDQSQSPATIAERGRLRELLKRRMEALKNGESAAGMEMVPGSLVGDILAETKAELNRGPDSEAGDKGGIGTVDVEGALQDIEAQLRELDRQSGILESSSPSLFERVKGPLKKFGKSLQ
jgi:hypothetical protein